MKNLVKFIALLFLSTLFLVSCGQSSDNQNNNTSDNNTVQTDNSSTMQSDNAETFVIKMAGEEKGKIILDGSNIKFFVNGTEYQSKLKGDKRKYAVSNGDIVNEVKYKDDAFKVRTPSGDLLWKIKLYDDKVKISDNEENQNPYEIKMGDSGKAKVKKDDTEIGKIKLKPEDHMIEITSDSKSYSVSGDKISLAYGVLLIDEIPDNLKYIIMSELLAKGK